MRNKSKTPGHTFTAAATNSGIIAESRAHIADNRNAATIQQKTIALMNRSTVVQCYSDAEIQQKLQQYKARQIAGDALFEQLVTDWVQDVQRNANGDKDLMNWIMQSKGLSSTVMGRLVNLSELVGSNMSTELCHEYSGFDLSTPKSKLVNYTPPKPKYAIVFEGQDIAHSGKYDGKHVTHTAMNVPFVIKTPIQTFKDAFGASNVRFM